MKMRELIQYFSTLPDWQSRYRHLIALGNQLPLFPLTDKTDDHLVPGCESKIWIVHLNTAGKHHFFMESEAKIIRGLLALLWGAVNGQATEFIIQFDFDDYLQKLGLAQHLSHSRSNGLQSVAAFIRGSVTQCSA
jgi:cysteine desulfuration protein SufE